MSKRRGGNPSFRDYKRLPHVYRIQFLKQMVREEPEVLKALLALLPLWDKVAFDRRPVPPDLYNWLAGICDSDPEPDVFRREVQDTVTFDEVSFDGTLSEKVAWESAVVFREEFAAVLERYCLKTDWLRQSLLSFLSHIAAERERYDDPKFYVELISCGYANTWDLAVAPEFRLRTRRWELEEKWKEFESRVKKELDDRLSSYRSAAIDGFQGLGYKRVTKPLNFNSVKWLIWWTIKRVPKETILEKIKKVQPSDMTVEDLNREFRRLQNSYGLPYRQSKRGRSRP